MNRIVEYCVVTMWLVSMTWLVARDAVPRWFVQPPPEVPTSNWLQDHGQNFQYGVYDDNGARKGTCWSRYTVAKESIIREDLLMLRDLQLLKQLAIISTLTFHNETVLDTVDVEMNVMHTSMQLRGERQGPKFAFELKIGTAPPQEFVLEARDAQTFCDSIKPFSALRDLSVGQTWTIQVLNPLSLIQNSRTRFTPVLVSVAGREHKQLQGRQVDCFVVESQGTRAWVAQDGRVLLQEVHIPGVGRLETREEPYKRRKFEAALKQQLGFRRHAYRHDRPR